MKLIRVLQFADVINRYDFIDNIIQCADTSKFEMSACVRTEDHNISAPVFSENTKYKLLAGNTRRDIPQTARRLARILREWQIDILHTHHFEQALIGALATWFYPKTKLIIGRHYSDSLYRLPQGFKSSALIKIEQTTNRKASRIIVPSQYIFEILTKKQNINPEKIDIVLYGFVTEKYNPPDAEEIDKIRTAFMMNGRFTVSNFSRLHEEKGHRYLIEAAALLKDKIPDLLILIVGEGPERKNLENQIRRLNLQDIVKLIGWRHDAMTIMAAADAVVQSTLQEAFSQVMVESLWMSKPLIITDVSGVADIIQNEENGIIVPKADQTALAEAIEKISLNKFLRDEIARNGRSFVEQNLYIGKIINLYEESYSKAVNMQ